jgi:hypothetical protein
MCSPYVQCRRGERKKVAALALERFGQLAAQGWNTVGHFLNGLGHFRAVMETALVLVTHRRFGGCIQPYSQADAAQGHDSYQHRDHGCFAAFQVPSPTLTVSRLIIRSFVPLPSIPERL